MPASVSSQFVPSSSRSPVAGPVAVLLDLVLPGVRPVAFGLRVQLLSSRLRSLPFLQLAIPPAFVWLLDECSLVRPTDRAFLVERLVPLHAPLVPLPVLLLWLVGPRVPPSRVVPLGNLTTGLFLSLLLDSSDLCAGLNLRVALELLLASLL